MKYTNTQILDIIKKYSDGSFNINYDHVYRTTSKIYGHRKGATHGRNGVLIETSDLSDFVDALISSSILLDYQDKIVDAINKYRESENSGVQQSIEFPNSVEVQKESSQESSQELPSIDIYSSEKMELISGVRKNGSFYIVVHGTSFNDIIDYVKIPDSVIESAKGKSDVNDIASVISFALDKVKSMF
jgi:hypothetical protein